MKYLNKQLIKVSGKEKFFEVLANSFNIDKVQINFFNLDTTQAKGSRQKDEINIYIDFPLAYTLCNDILSGRITKLVEKNANEGKMYNSVFTVQGGVTAERLAKQGKSRPDGCPLARVFKIIPSTKGGVCFQAESGKGNSDKSATGGIVPDYGTKPEHRVSVQVSNEQLKSLAYIILKHMNAYIDNQYATGAYYVEVESQEKK